MSAKKNDDYLKDLHSDSFEDFHFGRWIKTEARKKNIPPKKLAETISRYQHNEEKIFQRDDMDVEDVVKISYLLEYNFLETFSKIYLNHLPQIKSKLALEKHAITFNFKTRSYDLHGNTGSWDFLNVIHFGLHIKKLAVQNGWGQKEVADGLKCNQSTVSELYRKKSIKVKKMVELSFFFQRNLISELYLSQMMLVSPLKLFNQSTVTVTEETICLIKLSDKNFPIQFRPKTEKE